jgi:Tol biopolymer transport system component
MKVLFSFGILSTVTLLSAWAICNEEIALTTAPYAHGLPQWSPDGNWVMFTKYLTDTTWQIGKVLSSGGEETSLTSVHFSRNFWWIRPYPRWSPDGSWISYVVETFEEPHTGRYTIHKVAASGGPEIPLKLTAGLFAEWSPDGNWIAHEGKWPDTAETNFIVSLCKMPASGGANELLTTTGIVTEAQWSPSGAWIAYTDDYPRQIYKVSSSGGTAIPLTTEDLDREGIDWSPDGAWIAYGDCGINKVSSLGGPEIQLAQVGGSPQWSPDGNWIAYHGLGIKTVSASGDTIISWTDSGFTPQWSPDGDWIVYTKVDTTGYAQVYKVRLDSTGTISGHVRFEDNTPIDNVVVQALKGNDVEGAGITNSEGYYEIENLPSDTYKVRACFDNNGDLVCNYHNGSNPSVEDVEVTAGNETSDIDIIFPLPVIMVPGWKATSNNWINAKDYFQSDPTGRSGDMVGTKAYICFRPPAFDLNLSLIQNGEVLKNYISDCYIPSFSPTAPEMNIVAHSMGGLISRVYIHKHENVKKVNKLIMLATPNGGFTWINLLKMFLKRAEKDMTYASMKVFNQQIPNLHDQRFYFLAGRGDKGWGHFFERKPPKDCAYPYRYSDGVVGEWSVFNCVSRPEYCFSNTRHNDFRDKQDDIENVLRVLENRPVSASCNQSLKGGGCDDYVSDETQISAAITDTIHVGEIKQYQIAVEPSDLASFAVNWMFGELNLVLYDPSASLVDSTVAASDTTIEFVPCDSFDVIASEGYRVQNPLPGIWTLEISVVEAPVDSAIPFFAIVAVENNLSLSITTDNDYYPQGGIVLITSALYENSTPKTGATVYAKIMKPNYSIDSLDFFDDGGHNDGSADDGVYGNSYTNTSMGGRYSLFVTASGLTTGGDEFARQEILEFDMNPNTAHFTGYYSDQGVDVDGDGYFDSLRIEVGVEIDSAGDYEIVSSLVDSNNTEIDIANHSETSLGVGTHTFILDFSGQKIRENGVDGPYYLKDLGLFDETDILIQADYVEDAYTTSPYTISQFTSVEGEEEILRPQTFALFQNYPNPFNPRTNIEYVLPKDTYVKLTLYNILGQKVKTLVDEYQSAGYKTVWWDGKDDKGNEVASGIYFYRLDAGGVTQVKKMLLLK